jgi:hypothetical protein
MVIDTIETFDIAETIDVLSKHIISFAIEVVATGLPDGLTQVAVAATDSDMRLVCQLLDLDFEDARVLYDPDAK